MQSFRCYPNLITIRSRTDLVPARRVRRYVHAHAPWFSRSGLLAASSWRTGRRTVTRRAHPGARSRSRTSDLPFVSSTRGVVVASGGGRLLLLLGKAFVPSGAAVVIGIDDKIERRWDPRSRTRIYRAPVRSSKVTRSKPGPALGFPNAAGARAVGRQSWRLPFLTDASPSKRFYAATSRAPKTLLDGSAGGPAKSPLAPRPEQSGWSPNSRSPPSNSSPQCANHVCSVTSLAARSNLFAFPQQKVNAAAGRRFNGKRLKKLSASCKDPKVSLATPRSASGRPEPTARRNSRGTAIWYRAAQQPGPIHAGCSSRSKGEPKSRPSWLRSSTSVRAISSPGSSVRAGRSPFGKPAASSRRRNSAASGQKKATFFEPSGATQSVLHRHPLGARSLQSLESSSQNRTACIQKHSGPSAMQSPRDVEKYGHQILSVSGRAGIVS